MDKTVILIVNDEEMAFDVTLEAFNAYMNEMTPASKVAPSHNFLVRTVREESKSALTELLKLPGAPLELAGAVVEDYKPDLRITVGKPRP